MLIDLTDPELAVVDAARGGSELVCGDHNVDVLASTADPGLRVRAGLIRELLLGGHGELDPRGVRIRGARILGPLELDHVTAVAGLVLVDCVLDERVNLTRSVLPRLVMTGGRIAGVHADGVRVDGDLLLDRATISGTGDMGAVCVRGAHIGGQLALEETEVSNDSGPALHAGLLRADSMILRRARLTGVGGRSTVRLNDAHVRSVLNMDGAEIGNDSGPALHADRLRVDGLLSLREVRLSGHGDRGTARLPGVRIAGEADLQGAQVRNDSGPALRADGLRVDADAFLTQVRMSGSGESGAVRLQSARVGGGLYLTGAEVRNDLGPALDADDVQVDGDLSLSQTRMSGAAGGGAVRLSSARIGGGLTMNDVQLSGTGHQGAICLASARVGDDLYLTDAQVRNDSGPALYADGVQVDDTIVLLRATVSGTGDGGAVWLLGAQVGGLRIVETEVSNASGPALFANQIQVRGLMLLQLVRMSGTGDHAAIRLALARVGGQLALVDATIGTSSGLVLELNEAHVGGAVHLPAEVICSDPAACGHTPLVDVNEFAYASLGQADWREWLHLIRCHTKEYRPSPYQRLAAVERTAGHDSNARNILIAQQHDLRHRAPAALGGWLTRWFHWLWGALAGYGYRARRTGLALLVALAAAGLISLWAGHITTGPGRHAAERTTASNAPRTPCSTVELVGLGLDRGLPLGPTGLRTRCDLDTESTAGQLFTVLLWIVQAAVWGLATLAIAGYTGLIRKTI